MSNTRIRDEFLSFLKRFYNVTLDDFPPEVKELLETTLYFGATVVLDKCNVTNNIDIEERIQALESMNTEIQEFLKSKRAPDPKKGLEELPIDRCWKA